ncbi:MFS transporter [Pseudothermotoga thermarum]|uniref:Major facilitator superfamily MFS_1 n=1 Tax=Pseudothermotoga thermarum DSM 5069 TaxID=688269 RepID=F7YYK8_9THEM|nr:MFS transporter [Pseudothermotoga thermarum]AEH51040.1 major facilitator superfamily MFS_1 [Pseudothermotoga thermarum DSM 5069]
MAKYSNPFRALRNKNYLLFWSTQSISLIGTWIDTTLRGWVGVNVLPENKAAGFIGLIAFLKGFPTVFLSPVSGVLIDWFGPREVLFLTQVADTINACVMAFLVYKNILTPAQLLILSVLMGISGAFYLPSRNTFISSVVPKDYLPNALALHALIFNLARMIGPSIAGFVVKYYGLSFGFILNAISFVPLLIVLPTIPTNYQRNLSKERAFFKDLSEGLKIVVKDKRILSTFISLTVYAVFGMPYSMLMQAFAKSAMRTGLVGYGLVMGSMGLGAFVGAILAGGMDSKKVIQINEEFLILAIGTSTFVTSVYPNAAIFTSFVNGLCQTVFFNVTNSRTQLLSPMHAKGRVMSLYALINNGGSPVGTFVFGLLGNVIGIRASYQILALALIAYFVIHKFLIKQPETESTY